MSDGIVFIQLLPDIITRLLDIYDIK